MRKLSELIVLVRGGGEIGSAIAYRLFRSHFRVCMTEIDTPLAINRETCFSEAIYDSEKTIEEITAQKTNPALDQIYKTWRNGKIPIIVDPDVTVKPLLKPDVLIHAMMLKRKTGSTMRDAPLVIGIGPGFIVGEDVHLVVETAENNNLGKVIVEGQSEEQPGKPAESDAASQNKAIYAVDAGVFVSDKKIGDTVTVGDVIGRLNEEPLTAPVAGVLSGLLRNDIKVLANTRLAEINTQDNAAVGHTINNKMRAIAGGVLEAIMMSLNIDETA
jgi:xanthine dehydrogenase accessory factor